MNLYGQIIIGPPGAGKTTYCKSIQAYYNHFNRKTLSLNLDPGNDFSIDYDIDIREFVRLEDIETKLKLGPNASFLYSFDLLEKNIDWLIQRIDKETRLKSKKSTSHPYLLIDTPGQTEIYTSSDSFKSIIKLLTSKGIKLCCVNLIESNNLSDISKYVFSSLSVLHSMIMLELPQVNVITKLDLCKQFEIPYPLSFYQHIEIDEVKSSLDRTNTNPRFKKLNKLVAEFISDYSIVGFSFLDINNSKLVNRIAVMCDEAIGYTLEGIGSEENDLAYRREMAYLDIDDYLEEDYS